MVKEGVKLGIVFLIPVLDPCWEDTCMTPTATTTSDTNLADFVASRGLFKPASKWISILPPLDFVNLQALSLMSVSACTVVLVQQRIWKVLVHIKLREYI